MQILGYIYELKNRVLRSMVRSMATHTVPGVLKEDGELVEEDEHEEDPGVPEVLLRLFEPTLRHRPARILLRRQPWHHRSIDTRHSHHVELQRRGP